MNISFSKDKMLPLKALLAILIVADHLTFHTEASWLKPARELGAPAVAIFLFISGFGLARSYMQKGAAYLNGFFKKRIWKVLLPALVALLLFYIFEWNWSRDYIREFEELFTKGIPILPYSWFVEVILLLYASFWLVWSYVPGKWRLTALSIVSVLISIAAIALGYDRCWWVCNLAFPAGAFYAEYERKIEEFCLKSWKTTIITLALLGIAFLACYLPGNQYIFPLCYIFLSLIAAVFVSILPMQILDRQPLHFIGVIAYEMYLCQGIAMGALHYNLLNIKSEPVYIVAVYALTITLAWIVKCISNIIYKI